MKSTTVSNVEVFIPSTNYSDTRRDGIGVTAGTFQGKQQVSVGKAWVKNEEDGQPVDAVNLFTNGVISLSPDSADQLATELMEAAIRARALVPEPYEKRGRGRPRKESTVKPELLTVIKQAIDQAVKNLADRIGKPEEVKATKEKMLEDLIASGILEEEAKELVSSAIVD